VTNFASGSKAHLSCAGRAAIAASQRHRGAIR